MALFPFLSGSEGKHLPKVAQQWCCCPCAKVRLWLALNLWLWGLENSSLAVETCCSGLANQLRATLPWCGFPWWCMIRINRDFSHEASSCLLSVLWVALVHTKKDAEEPSEWQWRPKAAKAKRLAGKICVIARKLMAKELTECLEMWPSRGMSRQGQMKDERSQKMETTAWNQKSSREPWSF